jgi:hypothetical protein
MFSHAVLVCLFVTHLVFNSMGAIAYTYNPRSPQNDYFWQCGVRVDSQQTVAPPVSMEVDGGPDYIPDLVDFVSIDSEQSKT